MHKQRTYNLMDRRKLTHKSQIKNISEPIKSHRVICVRIANRNWFDDDYVRMGDGLMGWWVDGCKKNEKKEKKNKTKWNSKRIQSAK